MVSHAQVSHVTHQLHSVGASFSVLSLLVFSLVSKMCGPRYTSASRLASSAQCLRNIFSSVNSHVQFSQHNVWFRLHKCLAPRFICASLPVESAVHFSHQRHVTKEPCLNSKKRCVYTPARTADKLFPVLNHCLQSSAVCIPYATLCLTCVT